MRNSRNSRNKWANWAESCWFAPIFLCSLSMVRYLKVNYICFNYSAKCAEFAWFAGCVGESCGICVIRWNFPGFSAGAGTWNIIEKVSKMCEFCLIRGLCGRIARNLRNSLEFYRVLCRSRYLKHNSKMWEFSLIRGLCGRIAWNLRNSLEFYLMG